MKFRFPNPKIHPLVAIAAVLSASGYAWLMAGTGYDAYLGRISPAHPKTMTGVNTQAEYRIVETDAETAKFLKGTRAQVGVTLYYDPAYRKLDFPMGDVPQDRGVCTDVVIRAYRSVDFDLQSEVNADMKANFSKYPTKYGLSAPDSNIDHRRVPNLMAYFDRKGWSKEITKNPADYLPGDIVTWNFPRNQTHIGIVSEITNVETGIPLIYSNSGRGTLKEDILFEYEIIGHYRMK